MKRNKAFILFSLVFSAALFWVYRTPFILYWGVIYSMVFVLVIKDVKEKTTADAYSWVGAGAIMASPIFLFVKIGGYTSPSSFQALVMLGLFLILFDHRTGRILPLLSTGELLIAMGVKSRALTGAIERMSYLFVDVTSYLVKGGIGLFGIPITMNKNMAAVRDSIVIIGSGCSGLDAFVIYILATLLLIYVRRPGRKEATLLLLGALGIIPLNALRIFILLVIGYHTGISFLELFHSHLGDLMFLAYVFLYWRWAIGRKRENISGA